jgi:SAM-dependent methyltransferase
MRVADIGSGTGRIVNMLLDAEAEHVVAVEPSVAFKVLQTNTTTRSDRITYVNGDGESLLPDLNLDLVVSMGVLHHIPDPDRVMDAAFRALRPGGKMLVWLYGQEGNELYLRFANPIRSVTNRMPHLLLASLCSLLNILLDLYIFCSRFFQLPMRSYMRDVLARFPRSVRKLTIYDQLNPSYAKYYSKDEAISLLKRAGFSSVSVWHRHGYSWSVLGQKLPDTQ